jgi:hypothetical protein
MTNGGTNGDTRTLTEAQICAIWRASSTMPFLAELCEGWLDADETDRASYDLTIRSYIKGSEIEATLRSPPVRGCD